MNYEAKYFYVVTFFTKDGTHKRIDGIFNAYFREDVIETYSRFKSSIKNAYKIEDMKVKKFNLVNPH